MAFAPAGEAAAAQGGASATAAEKPRYEPLDECFAQPPAGLNVALDMDCGYVVVPESRDGQSDREVKLGVTRLSSGKGTANSPLFMLAGGPGQTQISPAFSACFRPSCWAASWISETSSSSSSAARSTPIHY
jgi:hypothetical protein